MKEKASPKRLKGTVLFTVVSVMMVLIVFLMGTLALAATASNRAASNYQKAQTEATARTVIDSVVQAINTNEDIRSQVASMTTIGSSISLDVQGTDGMSEDVTITCRDKRQMFDTAEQEWNENGYIYEVTTTVDKTKAETTYSAYIGAIRPETDAPGGGGGAFVSLGDTGGTEVGTGGIITGGTYIGVGVTTLEDYTLGGNGHSIIDAPFYMNGNLKNINNFVMHFNKPGDFFVVTGDFTQAQDEGIKTDYGAFSGSFAKYEDIPYFYIGGKFKLGSGAYVFGDDTHLTNIYAGSIDDASGGGLEVYGDVYTFDDSATNTIRGNQHATTLHKWASSVLNATGDTFKIGTWYSKGKIVFSDTNHPKIIEGDLRVDNDVEIASGTLTVTGDVVVNGTLKVTSGTLKCGNLYAGTVTNGGAIECNGTVKAGKYDGAEAQKVTVNSVQKTYTWYTDLTSSAQLLEEYTEWAGGRFKVTVNYTKHTVVEVDGTETSRTEEPGVYENENISVGKVDGAFPSDDVIFAGITDGNYTAITQHTSEADANVETNTGLDKVPNTHSSITAIDVAAGAYDVKGAYGKEIYPAAYEAGTIETTVLTPSTLTDYTSYPTKDSQLDPSIYDAAAGELRGTPLGDTATGENAFEVTNSCVLTGTFGHNIYINPGPGNPITVVLDDVTMLDNSGLGHDGSMIIVNDESQVTLYIKGTLSMRKSAIITTDYLNHVGITDYNAVKLNDLAAAWKNANLTIRQNAQVGDWDYPNVVIYAEDGPALGKPDTTLSLNANESIVTALIRAPKLTFIQRQAFAMGTINYERSTGTTTYGAGNTYANCVGVIGQLVAEHIEMENGKNWGLLFIDAGTPKKCTCGCAKCTDPEHPTKCTCKSNGCTCPDCICTGHLAGYSTPDAYNVMYYNFY